MGSSSDKINWSKLKLDYIFGEIESVNGFLVAKSLTINGNTTRKTKGWKAEKEMYQQKLEETIKSKTISEISDSEADVRARQAKVARYLQSKGLKAMEQYKPDNFPQGLRMVEVGLKQERNALGINNQQPPITNNYQNVLYNLPIMKTAYGKQLLKMNNEELEAVKNKLDELDEEDRAKKIY